MGLARLLRSAKILAVFFIYHFPLNLLRYYLAGSAKKNLYASRSAFAPVQDEITNEPLTVISGTLPTDLDGIFVRNGPNPQFLPNSNYHWFDGDGMLHAVDLRKGEAPLYRNRYVRTVRYLKEKEAGKLLYNRLADIYNPSRMFVIILQSVWHEVVYRFRNKGKKCPEVALGIGTANTALEFHDRRLLALVESDLPIHVTLPDLSTVGPHDYLGQLRHMFTAHPKVDAVTGEMSFFGYDMRHSCLYYRVAAADGTISAPLRIPLEVPVMLHDFAATDKHAIFPVLPLTFRIGRIFLGQSPLQFEEHAKAKFGILPRHATSASEMKWFELPSCWIWHTANAWEEGDIVTLIACRSAKTTLVTVTSMHDETAKEDIGYLHMWEFNLKTGTTAERRLDNSPGEFPVINTKVLGRKSRYVYWATYAENLTNADEGFVGIAKYDLLSGNRAGFIKYGAMQRSGEAVFCLRDGKTGEDEGYLITFVFDLASESSELWIMNAETMDPAQTTRLRLPRRVPMGFHGKWISRDDALTSRK